MRGELRVGYLWCNICKRLLHAGKFTRLNAPQDTYTHAYSCKDCDEQRESKRKTESKTKYQRGRRRKIKRRLLLLGGGKCCKCNYDEFQSALSFHHLDPGIKEGGISNLPFEEALVEIDKCAVLCLNCHASYHAGEWAAEFVKRDWTGWGIKLLSWNGPSWHSLSF